MPASRSTSAGDAPAIPRIGRLRIGSVLEEIARVVIMRRAQLGLTQQELAERMGTTKSVVSRIESGQHRTSTETLRRLAPFSAR